MHYWRRRLIRLATISLLLGACVHSPPPEEQLPENYIKLAQRKLSVIFHFEAGVLNQGQQEVFSRRLARKLRQTYRVEPQVYRFSQRYRPPAPDLYYRMVADQVDDLLIVELTQPQPGQLRVGGSLKTLADLRERHRIRLAPTATQGTAHPDSLRRWADLFLLATTKVWRDPGKYPRLDPRLALQTLYQQRACEQVVQINRLLLKNDGPEVITDLRNYELTQQKVAICENYVTRKRIIEKDRRARFGIHFKEIKLSKTISQALRSSSQQEKIFRRLAKLTNKPVTIHAQPGLLILEMRYHPRRYHQQTKKRPKYHRDYPLIYLDPFISAAQSLARIQRQALSKLPPPEREILREFGLRLRLTRLVDDFAEIDFEVRSEAVIYSPIVRVKMGKHAPTDVESATDSSQEYDSLILGPPRTASGKTTQYGLLTQFFEHRS